MGLHVIQYSTAIWARLSLGRPPECVSSPQQQMLDPPDASDYKNARVIYKFYGSSIRDNLRTELAEFVGCYTNFLLSYFKVVGNRHSVEMFTCFFFCYFCKRDVFFILFSFSYRILEIEEEKDVMSVCLLYDFCTRYNLVFTLSRDLMIPFVSLY